MGRAFEFRRVRKEKRWDKMSKAFTKLGKEIAISVKTSGPDPAINPRLRTAIQNAKAVNMPKDKIENAIKRASARDAADFQELVYEGYAQAAVAIVVECATDNATRTVANVRSYFNKYGGALAKTGALDFVFDRKGVFRIPTAGKDLDELEMELIEAGAADVLREDDEVIAYCDIADFAAMQAAVEQKNIAVELAEIQRVPLTLVDVPEDLVDGVIAIIEKLEDDDDVQNVYHNMNMA